MGSQIERAQRERGREKESARKDFGCQVCQDKKKKRKQEKKANEDLNE